MNLYILEAHLELHRQMMAEVKKLIPQTETEHGRELKLVDLSVDEDGRLVAEYSRYEGGDSYQTINRHIDPYYLFKEQA